MAYTKSTVFIAVLLVLNCHWAQCQYYGCYGGYYPGAVVNGYDNGNDLDTILPFLLLAMCNRNDYGGYGGYSGYGGYGGGCGGGCGGGGCGCGGGGCGCGGGGCGCGGGGCGCGGGGYGCVGY